MSLENIDGVVVESSGEKNGKQPRRQKNKKNRFGIISASVTKKDGLVPVQSIAEMENGTLKYFKSVNEDMERKASETLKNNERMDKVVERENEIQGSRRQEEAEAVELLRPELCRVFPDDCQWRTHQKNGNVLFKQVAQEDLIEKFLSVRSNNVRKFLLRKKFGDVAKEIFSFFKSDDFAKFLRLETNEEKGKEMLRVQRILQERGLGQWSNRTDLQKAGDSALKMVDDLDDLRQNGSSPHVVEPMQAGHLPDDQKGSPPHEGYFGSPEYRETVDDQSPDVPIVPRQEDDIVEGFGAVSEKMPEIVFEEDVKDSPLEDKMKNKTERGETFDAAVSDDLKELYGKAIDAQKACDEAGRLYAEAQGREDSLRTKVYRIFPRLREKLARELKGKKSLVDLEREYQKHLAELRQIKIDIANREAVKHGDAGKDIGKKMAEALIENNFRESVRMAELWAGEKRGDRRRMKVVRMAENAVEWYRKLDPKVKIAFSGVLFAGTVAAGGVNWPLFVAAFFPRMLGSAGLASAGKQLHEQYALGRLGKGSDVERNQEWNEEMLRQQANVPLEKFALYRKENQRRSRAWAGGGVALFLMGTGASYAGLARAAEHAADSEKVVGVVRQVLDTKPTGLSGSVPEVVVNPGPTAETGVKGAVETVAQAPGAGGLTPDAVGTGVIDHDVAAEIVGKIGKNISETSIVPEGSSFERVLSERLTETGIPKEEAGKLVHRAMLDLAEKTGKPFEFFNHIRPGAEIQYEIGSDGSLHVFGVTRKAGGEVIKRVAESVSGETPSPASVVQESTLQPKSLDISNASSPTKTLPLVPSPEIPTATIESPQDIFERRLPNISVPSLEDILKGNIPLEVPASEHVPPVVSTSGTPPLPVPEVVSSDQVVSSSGPPDAFDKYKGVAVAGAAIGAAASAVGGGALIKAEVSEMRARRKAQQEAMRKKEIEEEIEDTRKKNSDIEATQKRANEVIDQVLSIASFPDDRKEFLREVQDRYGVYGDTHPSEEAFRDTMGKIAGVLFGSEAVLQNENILGNMFLTVAQRGVFSEKEKESLEELRRGIQNGYSVFQGLFLRTGERIPKEKVEGLRVRDVLRLFTERFLTGKMPEELRGSRSNG